MVADYPELLNDQLIGRTVGELVGVFGNRTETPLARVIDGTSQTFLFGEASGTIGTSVRPENPSYTGPLVNGFAEAIA